MAWQQDPSGGTITSNYGASHGLEIIPTSRLEVGLFQPAYLPGNATVRTCNRRRVLCESARGVNDRVPVFGATS
jgi:hypothetical protein